MSSTLYYFLQVILCSGIMVGYYWLVLRNNRFHQYNRFYLLAIAFFSWIVPLIKIQWNKPVETDPQLIQFFSVIADNNTEIESGLQKGWLQYGWQGSLLLIYSLIAIILLVGLIKSLFQIYQLLKTHSCKSVGEVFLILTQAKGAPFSFFKYIFWHESIDLKSEAGKQMMQHELTHVQQKHSFDKIFIQLILIAGWFNPFFWAIKKEMEMIHEFIADKKAVANGDSASLAQMLLTAAYPQQQYLLTNPFFFSPIKRRLEMITKNANPKYSYMRRLIVLPLLAIVVVLFAFRTKELKNTESISVGILVDKIIEKNYFTNKEKTIINDTTILNSDSVYILPKDKKVKIISEGNEKFKVITLNGVAVQDSGFKTYIRISPSVIDSMQPLYVIDGTKFYTNMMNDINPNSIQSINVLKGKSAEAIYGEEGKRGVVEITSKKDFFESNQQIIKTPIIKSVNIDSFRVVKGYKIKEGYSSSKPEVKEVVVEVREINSNASVVEIPLNKEIVVKGYKHNTNELSERSIKSVSGQKINVNPLIILNGKPLYADFNEMKLDPNGIESVNVLKGESAIKKYGNAAEFGAIEVKTKSGKLPTPPPPPAGKLKNNE